MRLNTGDIFSIRVDEKGYSFGQIVKIPNTESISVIIFGELYKNIENQNLESILKQVPLFFANTFDAKFYHNDWKVVANFKANLPEIKFPYYKIGSYFTYIENFDEKKIRKATSKEEEFLMHRKYVAPIRLENALLAYNGVIPWNDELFNSLLYTYCIESNILVNGDKL